MRALLFKLMHETTVQPASTCRRTLQRSIDSGLSANHESVNG
jgi:hypothetical protein